MGNVGAIHVHPSEPSIACPGEKSAWTDPIGEDLVDDVQEFFSELIEVSREPVDYHTSEQYLVKDVIVEGPSPDAFTVRVIYDGVKLKKIHPPKEDEEDVTLKWYEAFADRNLLYFKTKHLDPTDGKTVQWELHSMMHPNKEEKNFKAEIWAIDNEGQRRHGKFIAGIAEWMWVKPLLMCRFGQKVKVRSNIESYGSGGRVALTEPLDDYFTAEQFFESLVAMLRKEVTEWKGELTTKSEEEFDGEWTAEFPLPKEMVDATGQEKGHWTHARNVVIDKKGLQVVIHERAQEELILTQFYRIYESPVRCEFWQMLPNGSRMGGGKAGMGLRLRLLALISEAEVRNEIQELSSQDNYMF